MDLSAMSTFTKVMGAAAKQLATAATHEHTAAALVPSSARTLSHAAYRPITEGLDAAQGSLQLVNEAIKLPVGRDTLQVAISARTAIKQGIADIIGLGRDDISSTIATAGNHFEHAGSLLHTISS